MKPSSLRKKDEQTMTLEQINEEFRKKHVKKSILLKTLALIDRIRKDMEGPLWSHIQEKLSGMVAGVEQLEDRADEYDPQAHPIPDRIIWKSLGVRKAAKVILAISKMVENEQGYRDSLELLEKEIKALAERKSKLGA